MAVCSADPEVLLFYSIETVTEDNEERGIGGEHRLFVTNFNQLASWFVSFELEPVVEGSVGYGLFGFKIPVLKSPASSLSISVLIIQPSESIE